MVALSPARESAPLLRGLELFHRGKNRDTYIIPRHTHLLLVVASDGISIFDHVLNTLVPDKGGILTGLTVHWAKIFNRSSINHHLVAYGVGINRFLPADLRGDSDLQSRALVVKRLGMIPVEFIWRACITGSAWKAYQRGEGLCGHVFPQGMQQGDMFPKPIDTPTTKDDAGDQPLSAELIRDKYGPAVALTDRAFTLASSHAQECGIVLPDTKLEVGLIDGVPVVADEIFTPDSSRFWDTEAYEQAHAQGKLPPSMDKDVMRAFGKEQGIDKLSPANPDDVRRVHTIRIPDEIVGQTQVVYHEIFRRLTGREYSTPS